MTASRIEDLRLVSCEHLLSERDARGRVKVRAESATSVLFGIVEPSDARQIAADLITAAARAEYEQDLWDGLGSIGMGDVERGAILHLVRTGEIRRETGGQP